VRRADNLTTFQVPIVLKSGSFNLLEPSGPVQASNGIVLRFTMVSFSNTQEISPLMGYANFLWCSEQPPAKPDVEPQKLISYSHSLFPFSVIIYLSLYLSRGLFSSDVNIH